MSDNICALSGEECPAGDMGLRIIELAKREERLEKLLRQQRAFAAARASLCRVMDGVAKCKDCTQFDGCDDAQSVTLIDSELGERP